MTRSCSPILTGLTIALFAGCTAAHFTADADREVQQILAVKSDATLSDREQWVLQPTVEPLPVEQDPVEPDPAAAPAAPAAPGEPTTPPVQLDLTSSLATAVRQNREFLARREGLYRDGLSYSLTRFQFGPQFAAALWYLWPRREGGIESHQAGTSFTASQILPTGATIALSTGVDAEWPFGPGSSDQSYGTSAGITLTQPLLRGAGYEVAYEPMTQAERELTYAIRDFEDFRQSFTIQIAQRFFELTSQKKTLANEDKNYENAVFDRKKAEALQQMGRDSELSVFRARRREIEAKDQLINANSAYDRAIDEFKILLGLPTTAIIELADIEPTYLPVNFAVDSAVRAALHNRLDLITDRQRVEDVERGLRLAEDALRPNLDLVANFGVAGSANDIGHAAPDEWNSSIGLSMDVPLQRKSQRNAYRSSLIALEQARRGLRLREDQLDLDIRDAVRRLRSLEERIDLQAEQIGQERRAVTVTEIRYETGNADTRDLFEARQGLIDAENALIRFKVEHFVARLNLLKDMGVFFVDDQGMWR